MAVGWAAMSGAALNIIVAPWFERRRGLAISIAFNGAAAGGIVLVPALVFLTGRIGFRAAVLSLVIVMVGVLTPLVLWLLVRGPEALGLAPDGDRPAPRASGSAAGEGAPQRRDFMRTWHFWSVALPFALGLTAQISVIIHQVSFLRPALGAAGAAWAVSLTSVCAVLGRLAVGLFVDRVNRRAVIAGNFLLQATSIVLMLVRPEPGVALRRLRDVRAGGGQHDQPAQRHRAGGVSQGGLRPGREHDHRGQPVHVLVRARAPGLAARRIRQLRCGVRRVSLAPAGGRRHSALRRIEIAAGRARRVGRPVPRLRCA